MKTLDLKSKNIRWGIIGCGDVTEVKSGPAYQKVNGFELLAVMRRDAKKSADYAKRHNVKKHYANANELINDPEIDAIYIATPPDSHHYYGLKVAQSGKPCCIEKPLSPSYQESLELYEAFQEKNIPLFVAYYRRTLPRFEKIKEWIDTNEIGTIRHISWQLTKSPSEADLAGELNWRTDAEVAYGGYFDDLASHGMDLFEYYLGNIKKVSGFNTNQQGLYTAKDAIVASWIHESGITGTGVWNFGSESSQDIVQIIGSKGKIEFAIFDEKPIQLYNENGKTEMFIEHPINVQLYHVEKMRDHLLGNQKHPSLGKSALHTNWVLDRILGQI